MKNHALSVHARAWTGDYQDPEAAIDLELVTLADRDGTFWAIATQHLSLSVSDATRIITTLQEAIQDA